MIDDLETFEPLKSYYASEYHRRNMQVARVAGAQAAVEQALERAVLVKSIPVWMIAYLESAASRLPGLSDDLAAWRDLAHDNPRTKEDPSPDVGALATALRHMVYQAEWLEKNEGVFWEATDHARAILAKMKGGA